MSKPLCINATVCSEYQRLLEESESALGIWEPSIVPRFVSLVR